MSIAAMLDQYRKDNAADAKLADETRRGERPGWSREGAEYLATASYYRLAGAEVVAVLAGAVRPADCVTAEGRFTPVPDSFAPAWQALAEVRAAPGWSATGYPPGAPERTYPPMVRVGNDKVKGGW